MFPLFTAEVFWMKWLEPTALISPFIPNTNEYKGIIPVMGCNSPVQFSQKLVLCH